MKNKNLLLGYGETLTKEVKLGRGGGSKNKPYTYEENKIIIMQELLSLVDSIRDIPDNAKPNGEAVAKITLHPAFLAKSYFPVNVFKPFNLRSIGSKSVKVKPRKVVQGRGRIKEEYSSVCIYVSGKIENFQDLYSAMDRNTLKKGEKDEIITFEEISFFDANDKIKNIEPSQDVRKIEIALHTPNEDKDIINSFIKYAESCGAQTNTKKIISVNGLTFLPIEANALVAKKIADFSFLRTVRDQASLRINNPVFTRSVSESKFSIPKEKALNNDIKVAIFDGGIGNTDFEPWVKEYTFSDDAKTSGQLLSHGQDVTSTVLFGPIAEGQKHLPVPPTQISITIEF